MVCTNMKLLFISIYKYDSLDTNLQATCKYLLKIRIIYKQVPTTLFNSTCDVLEHVGLHTFSSTIMLRYFENDHANFVSLQ